MGKSNILGWFLGLLLLFLGIIALFNYMNNFWPLFILVPGLIFEFSYFLNRKFHGVLVPGGILTTIGMLYLFETFTDWRFAEYTWPIYTLSVAIGLFQLYLFGNKRLGLLIPIFILGGFSIIAYFLMLFGNLTSWLHYSLLLPIILIILGVFILILNARKSNI